MPLALPHAVPLVRSALTAAVSLAFPTWCVGCDVPDTPLCASCRGELTPRVTTRHALGLRVDAGLTFQGVAARALRAAKEEGRTGLLRSLAPALDAAVAAALAVSTPGPVVLVPVPTSSRAMMRRGYRVIDTIARRAHLPLRPLLSVGSRAADQRLLGRADRAHNVHGTMRSRSAAGLRILLIDDVVTTGATLSEAARALSAAGGDVLGAATVASTPRRTAGSASTDGSLTGTDR